MVACGVLPIDRMTQHREAVQVVATRVGRCELERVSNIRLPDPKPYEPQNRPPTAYELLRAVLVPSQLILVPRPCSTTNQAKA
jgi:large subunit GTPase 1